MAYRPPSSWQEPVSQWRCARQRLSPVAPHGRLELTLPGFVHDLGSAVHPMALASPFFSTLPLTEYGLNWISPSAELAHPLDDGTAVTLEREIGDTACQLGTDAVAYRRLYTPLLERWDALRHDLLKPIIGWPQHPVAMARFGLLALRSARSYRPQPLQGSACPCALRRIRRALLSPLGVTHLRLLRPRLGGCRPRCGLAYSARRRSVHCGCTRHLLAKIRRHGDYQRAGAIAARLRGFETIGRDTQAVSIPGRRGHSAILPPPTRSVTATVPACSRWTGPSASRFHGAPLNAFAPAPSTWAAPLTRLRPRNASRQ